MIYQTFPPYLYMVREKAKILSHNDKKNPKRFGSEIKGIS
jgi:hypothetical protein